MEQLEGKVEALRRKVRRGGSNHDNDGGGRMTATSDRGSSPSCALLRDALDVLRPETSQTCRDKLVVMEEAGRAAAYLAVQKEAAEIVQRDFVKVLCEEDGKEGDMREGLTLLVEAGTSLASFIDGGEGGGGGGPSSVGATSSSKEFRPFAALSACWSAAGKIAPVMTARGLWHCKESEAEEVVLLKWLLPKVSAEAVKYVRGRGDKKVQKVMKFWFQTFNKLFNCKDLEESPLHKTSGSFAGYGEVVPLFHSACLSVEKAIRGVKEGANELRAAVLSKMMPFSSFIFQGDHSTCAESGPKAGPQLIKLLLAAPGEGGRHLLVEALSHYGNKLDLDCLETLAPELVSIASDTILSPSTSAPVRNRASKVAMSVMMQCAQRRSLWDKVEVSVLKIFARTANPVKLGATLDIWCEVLKFASSSSSVQGNKLVSVHLAHLLECMLLVAPNSAESRRSMIVSEQLAAVICKLVEQKVIAKDVLTGALESFEKDHHGNFESRLAFCATKLCLSQCCPELLANVPRENLISVCRGGKRGRDDSQVAMDALQEIHSAKRSKAWRDHVTSCALELLAQTSLEALSPSDVTRLEYLLSRSTEDPHLKHYLARIVGKMPIHRRQEEHFHDLLQSRSFSLVHLAMESLTQVCKRLHGMGQDFRHLVPTQVHDYKQGSAGGKFVKCLNEHFKRPLHPMSPDARSPRVVEERIGALPWVCSSAPESETDRKEIASAFQQVRLLLDFIKSEMALHARDDDVTKAVETSLKAVGQELDKAANLGGVPSA
ncbi:hypothetical protein HOP50_09g56500 [Chloropicon primus]|nr:hypothetical protein HOP50_09g56500 [Chloropicon primus]